MVHINPARINTTSCCNTISLCQLFRVRIQFFVTAHCCITLYVKLILIRAQYIQARHLVNFLQVQGSLHRFRVASVLKQIIQIRHEIILVGSVIVFNDSAARFTKFTRLRQFFGRQLTLCVYRSYRFTLLEKSAIWINFRKYTASLRRFVTLSFRSTAR